MTRTIAPALSAQAMCNASRAFTPGFMITVARSFIAGSTAIFVVVFAAMELMYCFLS
ncbi:MAG: hypothetical protein WC598_03140 [Methanoregula sp.]